MTRVDRSSNCITASKMLSIRKTADHLAYHFEPAPVDDGEGAVADEVLGGVLVDPHRLHPEAVAGGGGGPGASVPSHGGRGRSVGRQPNRSRNFKL